MRNRLKSNPDSITYSLFVRAVSISSRGVLWLTASRISANSPMADDFVFGGERDELVAMFPKEQKSLVKIQMRALYNYQPGRFSGDLTLFSTGPDTEFYPGDPTRGWNSVITGKTGVIDVPGDHGTLFSEPFGHVLAQKIEEALKRTDAYG
jgi:thioesterase domain-containing protein